MNFSTFWEYSYCGAEGIRADELPWSLQTVCCSARPLQAREQVNHTWVSGLGRPWTARGWAEKCRHCWHLTVIKQRFEKSAHQIRWTAFFQVLCVNRSPQTSQNPGVGGGSHKPQFRPWSTRRSMRTACCHPNYWNGFWRLIN